MKWAQNGSIRRVFHGAICVLCIALGSSSAQTVVNGYTTGGQGRSSIAADGQGRFIVVWVSSDQDGDGTGIFGRQFEASGQPIGDDFAVNGITTGDQTRPRVSANADGDFVVVWQNRGEGYPEIFGRRFDSAAMPIGGEFMINEDTTLYQSDPAVALADDDSFMVVWWNNFRLDARHFDSSGSPTTGEFALAIDDVSDPTGFRSFFDPRAEALPGGNFVIAWTEYYYPASYFIGEFEVRAAVFDENVSLVTEFEASAGDYERKRQPQMTSNADGDFVVVWASYTDYEQYSTLSGRRFSSMGSPQGPIFDPTPADAPDRVRPAGVANVGDDFLVVWDQVDSFPDESIFGIYVGTDGAPSSVPFLVNTDVNSSDSDPALAGSGSDFMATWTRSGDVVGKFAAVFADGFESGDTTAWTSTVAPPPD